MLTHAAITAALHAAGLPPPFRNVRGAGHVGTIELADGARVVIKTAADAALAAEEAGLAALREHGVLRVPRVLLRGHHAGVPVLVMEHLEPARAGDATWRAFGDALARHHAVPAGSRYGFAHDNVLGRTPQPNGWDDDWARFNQERRLRPQIAAARRAGHLDESAARRLESVAGALPAWLAPRPAPALLHGDLWSGNALPTRDGAVTVVAVIDPACSIGDGLADLAMMQLFGGFPAACFDAYFARRAADGDPDDEATRAARLALYQLYHVLNHVNLFGAGYVGQAMQLARQLPASGAPKRGSRERKR